MCMHACGQAVWDAETAWMLLPCLLHITHSDLLWPLSVRRDSSGRWTSFMTPRSQLCRGGGGGGSGRERGRASITAAVAAVSCSRLTRRRVPCTGCG